MSKGHGINTDINDTEYNDTDSFYSAGTDYREADGKRTYKRYYDYFKDSLEIDLLMLDASLDKEELNGILNLLAEVCSSNREKIRINREDMPAEIVRDRLMKLNSEHIRYVLRTLGENTTRIRDTKQYMLAVLFNAPITMATYYKNWAGHDMVTGKV